MNFDMFAAADNATPRKGPDYFAAGPDVGLVNVAPPKFDCARTNMCYQQILSSRSGTADRGSRILHPACFSFVARASSS